MKIHEQLTEQNWWRGYGPTPAVGCLVEWINRNYNPTTTPTRLEVKQRIHTELGLKLGSYNVGSDIMWWNDQALRTFDEVLALCKKLDI